MQSYDITVARETIPASFTAAESALPGTGVGLESVWATDWAASMNKATMDYRVSLKQLSRAHGVYMLLDSDDMAGTKWPTDLLRDIALACDPLHNIRLKAIKSGKTTEWLAYWEVISQCIVEPLISKCKAHEGQFSRINSVHSFHIDDVSVDVLQCIIECELQDQCGTIDWKWLTPAAGSHTSMIKGETGTSAGQMTITNMRSWRNRILSIMKDINVIICGPSAQWSVSSTIIQILFSLINLALGGTAVVWIPCIDPAMMPAIHLFSYHFRRASITHLAAEDRVYLCGNDLIASPDSTLRKTIDRYCDSISGQFDASDTGMGLLSSIYMTGQAFAETISRVSHAISGVRRWRYKEYEKILSMASKLFKSTSMTLFGSHLERQLAAEHHDRSDEWAQIVGFNHLSII